MIRLGNNEVSFKIGSGDCTVYLGATMIQSGGTDPTPPTPTGDTWYSKQEIDEFGLGCLEYDGDDCIKYGYCTQWDDFFSDCEGEYVEVPCANVSNEYGVEAHPYISKIRINQDYIDNLTSGEYVNRNDNGVYEKFYAPMPNDEWLELLLKIDTYKTPNGVTYARMRLNVDDGAMMDGTDSLANPININGAASGLVIDFESTFGIPLACCREDSENAFEYTFATSAATATNFSFDSTLNDYFWDNYSFGCSMQIAPWGDPEFNPEYEYRCNYTFNADGGWEEAFVMCNDCWEACCKHLWDVGDEANPWDTTQYANEGCRDCSQADCDNEWNEECCGGE